MNQHILDMTSLSENEAAHKAVRVSSQHQDSNPRNLVDTVFGKLSQYSNFDMT